MIIINKVLLTISHSFNLIIYCLSSKSFRRKIFALFCDTVHERTRPEVAEQLPMLENEVPDTAGTNFTKTTSFKQTTNRFFQSDNLPSMLKRAVSLKDFNGHASLNHNNVLLKFKSVSYLDLPISHITS